MYLSSLPYLPPFFPVFLLWVFYELFKSVIKIFHYLRGMFSHDIFKYLLPSPSSYFLNFSCPTVLGPTGLFSLLCLNFLFLTDLDLCYYIFISGISISYFLSFHFYAGNFLYVLVCYNSFYTRNSLIHYSKFSL